MTYNGLVLAVEKRRSTAGRRSAPTRCRERTGLQAVQRGHRGGPQVSTDCRRAPLHLRPDPNDLTNARGRLPNDRPHMFRVMASVDVPRTGLVVAANVQHFSGKPWAASAQVPLPQSPNQRILLEPRGSRRLSSQTILDLRLSQPFAAGGRDGSSCCSTCSTC